MALKIIAFNTIGTNVRVNLGTTNDAFIAPGVTVGSEDSIAIAGTGSNHEVNVQGTVFGANIGISLGDDHTDSNQRVLVGKDAYVGSAVSAVVMGGSQCYVDNRGTISGGYHGLYIGDDDTLPTTITNSGLIEGGAYAIQRAIGANDRIAFTTTGEVRSDSVAYDGASGGLLGIDVLVNAGLMQGLVTLGYGDDQYDGRSGRVLGKVYGGNGADTLLGGVLGENFSGNDGNDSLDGGAGNDLLDGGNGTDRMFGRAGNDGYMVDNAGDVVDETGGNGIDSISSSITFNLANTARAIGAVEELTLTGNSAIDGIGNALANVIFGNMAKNVLSGLSGNDSLSGEGDNDTLRGDAGSDLLDGGSGADRMLGGVGNDGYMVDNAGDVVSEAGGTGIDTVNSSVSFNLANTARAIGAVENLTLLNVATAINGTGNSLANTITGNGFANTLNGFTGNDRLTGAAGSDTLVGGKGVDTLSGGLNNDFFVFNTPLSAANRDVITDFANAAGNNDTFRVENAIFSKLGAAGALKGAFFHAGASAADANDFVVYNKATGSLFYDADGSGAGAAIQFATVTAKPTLTAGDFVVI
jgi:Ca2+-binding RTX toxin-like protein